VCVCVQEVAAVLVAFDQHAAWENIDVCIRYTRTHTQLRVNNICLIMCRNR